MAPKYKLTYFDLRGRGEFARLVFAAADYKDFTDERVSFADWPERKKNAEQGSLPILEVTDGSVTSRYVQTMAIVRHLARAFDLYGKGNNQMTIIDIILDNTGELLDAAIPIFFIKDEAEKAEKTKAFIEGALTKYLAYTVNWMKKTGADGFAVGKSLTVADIAISGALDLVKDFQPFEVPDVIKANKAKFEGLPKIKAYMAKRT